MRVTAKGEYATQAVLYLALQYPGVLTIHEIAQRHHIPLKYLEQILLELKRGGILESRRGVNGGYTLARAPEKISVGEVLRIVDGAFVCGIELHPQRNARRGVRGRPELRAEADLAGRAGSCGENLVRDVL